MKKEKTELEKLSVLEIYRLFNKGELNAKEFDELRTSLPKYKQEKLNNILRVEKKKEIVQLYEKGGLSISDTIAYITLVRIERNRKNTSTIVTIIVISIVLTIIGSLFIASRR
jgi:lipase chaperone LimK|tara:strand:- start:133 stop:471 length:339 start_codon:yes stop_codon:yes gene_type:complete